MSKHREVIDRMRALREKRDDRLSNLLTRMDGHESTSDKVFRSYEGELDEADSMMIEMEKEIEDMRNAREGTDEKLHTFQNKDQGNGGNNGA